ncbi:MAG: glycosyltransferase family 25 protein [Paracoccaceae bacterium]
MNHDETPPIFYINLDRAPERRAFMESQFKNLGLKNATRFAALDVKNPATLRDANYKPGGWRARWSLTPTEIAVFESHRALWTHIVTENLEMAIIMEDDVFISKTLVISLADLAKPTCDFDVIRLDGCKGNYPFGPENKVGSTLVRPILQTVSSLGCYLLSRSGAEHLTRQSAVYCDHADDFVLTPKKHWKLLQSWPAIALQGANSKNDDPAITDILDSERTSVESEIAAPDKGPPLYRISKELRRVSVRMARKIFKDRVLLKQGGHIGYPPLAGDLPPYRE